MMALCIGGPLDGQWRKVEGPDLYSTERIPALPPLKDPHHIMPSAVQHRRYLIERIKTPKQEFYFAIEDGLSIEYAMKKLMDSYKP